MKIIVDTKKYTKFDYSPYLRRGNPVEAPEKSNYVVGQVVVVPDTSYEELGDNFVLAVVLGCIDEEYDGTLRTDTNGMVSISEIRPAVAGDFHKINIKYWDVLYRDVFGL